MRPAQEDSKMAATMLPGPSARRSGWLGAALLLAAALAGGCISDERIADDWVAKTSAREASAPLGGEGLAQRKLDLERSYRDLGHFLATLDGLHRRGDRGGVVMFAEFADFYVTKHLVPILEPEWQSRHPELAQLDVNARIAVVALWAKLGSSSSADHMLDEIDRRYQGRGEMLVGYPIGGQSTLRQAVARLRKRSSWSG
jgi:hypothetical protein